MTKWTLESVVTDARNYRYQAEWKKASPRAFDAAKHHGWLPQACAHMRLFVSGSAPLLVETFDSWTERTGHVLLERYGMSEAGVITSNPLLGDRKGGTVGRPLAGMEVRVAGEGDRLLPAGENGSVQIRGESVFKGYWRMPEKTREEFTMDGWFRTGDVGVWDADGYLSIVGRAKDLIISGGYNVYPKEIEIELVMARHLKRLERFHHGTWLPGHQPVPDSPFAMRQRHDQ